MHRLALPLAVLLAVSLAACGGGAGTPGAATTAPPSPAPATGAPSPVEASPGDGGGTQAQAPSWAAIELVDARSGDAFRLADLAGSTVFIEPMAIWCTSCRRQQREAKAALGRLDREQVRYLSLGVDPSESAEDLGRYADQLGFDWLFAIAPTSLAAALADEFGDQVLNPPSTPILLVRPDGTVELVGFGYRSADDLVAIAADA